MQFKSIEFRAGDNRLNSLKLGHPGLSGAAMSGSYHAVRQPSEGLHKKAGLVERGSFRPPAQVNFGRLRCVFGKFQTDPAVAGKAVPAGGVLWRWITIKWSI